MKCVIFKVVLRIKLQAFCSLVICVCICVFLVHIQIFDHAFTCRIIIQMVLVVIFSHQTFPCFLPQMSIHMHVAGQKCLVPRSLCSTHCESMLYNMPFCCQGGSSSGGGGDGVWVYVCLYVCVRIRSVLASNTSAVAACQVSNECLVSECNEALCTLAGVAVSSPHANCVLNVQN